MHDESIPTVTRKRPPETCSCERPLPRERAAAKGRSQTVCARCDRPVSLSLGRPTPPWAA